MTAWTATRYVGYLGGATASVAGNVCLLTSWDVPWHMCCALIMAGVLVHITTALGHVTTKVLECRYLDQRDCRRRELGRQTIDKARGATLDVPSLFDMLDGHLPAVPESRPVLVIDSHTVREG